MVKQHAASENAALAQFYASNGIMVFPCHSQGGKAKAPLISNGYHGATADPVQVQFWNAAYPTAIYGLPCAPNDLIVLDADRHGEGDGVSSLMALFTRHGFDWRNAPCITTPRNGLHVIFRRPQGLGTTKARVATAIDTRDKGYVIAPGTILPDGRCYALLNGSIAELAQAIARKSLPLLPEWLVSLIQPATAYAATPRHPRFDIGKTPKRLAGLVRKIAFASPGERNATLYWASCRAGELVDARLIESATAAAMLSEAAIYAGLTTQEVTATIRSGLAQGIRSR